MPYQQLLGVDMLHYMQRVLNAREEEKGASAVEYGLLVAAIAAIIVLIVFAIGKFVKQGFQDTCTALDSGITQTGGQTCS
jgi:pilus assembly protein Flp/PilA